MRNKVQMIAVKVLDKVFVHESNSAFQLRLQEPGKPLIEVAIFIATLAYLYAFYVGVRNFWAMKASKVKGT